MKLMWFSTAPYVGAGYGVLTKELVKRLIKDGHQVKIATKHLLGGSLICDGVELIDGTEIGLINKIVIEEGYDYLISCMDNWPLPEPFAKWVAIDLLDTEFIHPKAISVLKSSLYQISLTEHDKRELERVGYKPLYAPLGVDTNLFKPDPELRKTFRTKKGFGDDTFVIGVVGINYITDRKNITGTLRAFQGFHKRHPDSILYLHTDVLGSASQGLPLQWVMKACGFPDDNSGAVRYVQQVPYHLWSISQAEMAQTYNGFDVFCLPSQGEGFGMPWLEAQACGVPAIAVDTTSGKQLNFGGFLIPQVEDYFRFSTLQSWIVVAPPSAIDEMLEQAYQEWKSGKIEERKKKAREGALAYDWDVVYEKYWRPVLKVLENRELDIRTLPNYGTGLYETFKGRLYNTLDCGCGCPNKEACNLKFPLLPGEWEGPNCILSRSYPIVPDLSGNLAVSKKCILWPWLSPRFVEDCRRAWGELLSYPKIRKALEDLWQQRAFNDWGELTLVDNIPHGFDASYHELIQHRYITSFQFTDEVLKVIPPNGSILDVGAGDGRRVKFLREKGYTSTGTDINKACIDGDVVVGGDIMKLPFENDSFDITLCIDVLEHLKDPLGALRELLRVAKKYVVIQVTPTNSESYIDDATHCVPWDTNRWKREIVELCDIVQVLPNASFILKRKGAPNI